MSRHVFPVGYAIQSRYRPHRVKHALAPNQGGWRAICNKAEHCVMEWHGTRAALDCERCLALTYLTPDEETSR